MTATVIQTVTAQAVAPTVSLNVPSIGTQGTAVAVSATVSDTAPQDSFTYAWTVVPPSGATIISSQPTFSFTPLVAASYQVNLTVTDSYHKSTSTSQTVVVGDAPPVIIQRRRTAPFSMASPVRSA